LRIKKLELLGFKSFKDRTVIQFDAGTTGVVGPNGCGKSNIVDALVWVMGEMSAKHLRGSSMEDVIFAGAEGYAPMGMAEVSLTLENDGGPFPAKYMKFSELMVTRRLHRNGESEYLINKEPARLRDIQEIFMDTGAGSKGFSIIEQGQIGKIITAKPVDRRVLIEEAAGITKFKVRKRESQRKLQATDQNLLRLQDILSEQKRQLDSLERQAQRAERYRKLKGELQEKDLWLSSKQYLDLHAETQNSDTLATQSRDEEASLSAELSQNEIDLESRKLSLAEKEHDLSRRQSEHRELSREVTELEFQIRELNFAIGPSRKTGERAGSLVGQYELRRQNMSSELDEAQAKLSECREDLFLIESQFNDLNRDFQTRNERIADLDQQLTARRRELLSVSAALSHAQAQFTVLDSKLTEKRAQTDEMLVRAEGLAAQKMEFEGRRNRLFKELEDERQMQMEINRSQEAIVANLNELKASRGEREDDFQQLKDELNETASRLYGLENLQSNFEGFEEGVKSVMMWQKLNATSGFKPLAEVVEVEPRFELAMEAALGSRLQTLLGDSSDQALSAVSYLKEQKSGRSSFVSADGVQLSAAPSDEFLPLKGLPGVEADLLDVVRVPDALKDQVIRFLRGIVVVDSIRTALSLRPQNPGRSFVTLVGDTLTADGVLTGGASEGADSGVLRRRREIKELSLKRDELSGKVQLAKLSLDKVIERISAVERELEEAKTSAMKKEIVVAQLRKDLERAEIELENSIQAHRREVEAFDREQIALTSLEENAERLSSEIQELAERQSTGDSEASALQLDLDQAKNGFDDHSRAVTDLRVKLAERRQELEGRERQCAYLAQALSDVESQLGQMTEESARAQSELSDNQIKVEECQSRLTVNIHRAQESERSLADAQNTYSMAHTELLELEKNVSEKRSRVNQLRQILSENTLKLEQFKMREENLRIQISERYGIALADYAPTQRDIPGDTAMIEAEVLDLRDKVKRIGDVNLAAINEYDELKNRYEFLNQQFNDLVEAKDHLRKVIDRINRICSRRFKETFEQVNSRFQQVFPVLFGGGEAALILVEDPDGDEDPGIDIIAKPPGKKLQNVSLLSGGEKALTAVSLIFSIFLVKPSPFCLLDEVDAPLDDANVMRFNELVREMAKRSQIITVTHNKHTMKVNNKLYGVTMQEKGVSKMVSVSLEDAARLAEA